MDPAAAPEPPNEVGFADLLNRLDEGPVTMLNLLAFKAGGRVVFQGPASPALLGEESWDLVLLVEYPTRRAFLEMVQSPEYDLRR